jgi:putative DNA primase/helicase
MAEIIRFESRQSGGLRSSTTGTVLPPLPAVADRLGLSARDRLADGFVLNEDGVHAIISAATTEEDAVTTFVCSPLAVVARFRNFEGQGRGRIVALADPEGKLHHTVLEDSQIQTKMSAVLAKLVGCGLRLGRGPKAREALQEFLLGSCPERLLTTTNRLGWTEVDRHAFVLGAGRVVGDQSVIYRGQVPSHLVDHVVEKSTLADWKACIGARCVGNPLMIVAVALALTGPLHELLGREGGGLHFVGKSSRGKSTLLNVAVSVWGSPEFRLSWRATSNGLEGEAAAANGMLLALDEIGETPGRDLDAAVYTVANGAGKARADALGQTLPRLRWRVAMISTGEVGIEARVTATGGQFKAGHSVRLIDVPADDRRYGAFDDLHGAADGAAFADSLKQATAASYGTLGPAFVDLLIRKGAIVEGAWARMQVGFRRQVESRFGPQTDGQVTRIIDRFALIALAGEMATMSSLTAWPPGTALNAAHDILGKWLEERPAGDPANLADVALGRIKVYLDAHPDRVAEVGHAGSMTGDAEQITVWTEGDRFLITAGAWKDIHAGLDPQQVAKTLLDAGHLVPGDGKNLARKPPRCLGNVGRVYALHRSALDLPQDGTSPESTDTNS